MIEAKWQTPKQRIDTRLRALQPPWKIVRYRVWRVERLFALADPLEERLARARGQVDALTPSLPPSLGWGGTSLTRAFAGQLVSQDPTDEPAEKLLERIPAARSS